MRDRDEKFLLAFEIRLLVRDSEAGHVSGMEICMPDYNGLSGGSKGKGRQGS